MAETTQDQLEQELLAELDKHFLLTKKILVIMATQQEVAQQINAFTTQLGKVNDEIQAKITELSTAAGSSDNVSPELQSAIDGLAGAVQKLDDIVPDAPVVEVPPADQPPADAGDGTAVSGV